MHLVDPELLNILACPECKGVLEEREKETLLACKACRKGYSVENGIPILLVDKAKPLA